MERAREEAILRGRGRGRNSLRRAGRFAAGHYSGAEQEWTNPQRADADHPAADGANAAAGDLYDGNAVLADCHRPALPAPGAGDANSAVESGAGGTLAVSHAVSS